MRLFAAVDVPTGARASLDAAVAPLRDRHDAVRWIPARNWHITLAFLGELTTAQRLRTQVALGMAARASAPCDLTLDGTLGRFGDRVLWAHVVHDDALTALAAAVRGGVDAAGVTIDPRPFRAHLTIARGRRGRAVPRVGNLGHGTGLPVSWTVATLVLYASRPTSSGSRYRSVAAWPLAGRGRGRP
ncbi:MAG TPA: RNA 2',3'-cyclic phosphodiesterase [Euzebyales bacterium]